MSWQQLRDILAENQQYRLDEQARPPESCPNDGEPLDEGPDGTLHCRHDGYTWP